MKARALVLALTAVLAVVSVPTIAHADDGSSRWVLQDDQGLLSTDFGSSQTVYVTGVPKNVGGFIPAADVYVVPNQNWAKADGQVLHDVSNPTGTPNTVVGFEVDQSPICLPYLRVGAYDVVFDYGEDGHYDASVDDVLGVGSGPGFTVHYDGDSRSIDKTRLKQQLAAPLEAAAQQAAGLYGDVLVVDKGSDVYDALHLTADLGSVIDDEASPDAFYLQLASDATWQVFDPFSLDVTVGEKGLDKAAHDLSASAAGIAADPPDPHYKKVAPPVLPPYTYDEHGSDPLANIFAVAANRAGQAAAYQLALRHAMERLDGASAANDEPYVALQAQAIADNANQLVTLYPRLDAALKRVKASIVQAGLDISLTSAERALFASMKARVRSSGFTADELTAFTEAGLTDVQIARVRSWILGIDKASLGRNGARDASNLAQLEPAARLAAFDANVQSENLAGSLPSSVTRRRP